MTRHTYDYVLMMLLCAGIKYQEAHEIAALYICETPYKYYVFEHEMG